MSHDDPFLRFGYVLLLLAIPLCAAGSTIDPRLGSLPLALVFGWSQIGGY